MSAYRLLAVHVLEAYYGGEVVLDYADPAGREAAIRLAVLTIREMEHCANNDALEMRVPDWESAISERPGSGFSVDAAVSALQQWLVPVNRYFPVVCRCAAGQEYSIGVLSEDGTAVTFGPADRKSNEWYDAFWAALWRVALTLEGEIAGFTLHVPGGKRVCAREHHRMSPFRLTCDICGSEPVESGGA